MTTKQLLAIIVAVNLQFANPYCFAEEQTSSAPTVNVSDIGAALNRDNNQTENPNQVGIVDSASAASQVTVTPEPGSQSPSSMTTQNNVNVADVAATVNSSESLQQAISERDAALAAEVKPSETGMGLFILIIIPYIIALAYYIKANSKYKPAGDFARVRWPANLKYWLWSPLIVPIFSFDFLNKALAVGGELVPKMVFIAVYIVLSLIAARAFAVGMLGYVYDEKRRILSVPHLFFMRKDIAIGDILDVSQWITREVSEGTGWKLLTTHKLNLSTRNGVHEAIFFSSGKCDQLAAIIHDAQIKLKQS